MNISKTNKLFSIANLRIRTPLIFGIIIVIALFSFEIFNFSTTEFALHDLLGELRFAGLRWATILSIAFCGIDFAGIARLFTPKDEEEARETWYLFGAWLLAATMNALLTWWGVSMAILNHSLQSTSVVAAETVSQVVPVFVAVMVWLIRILIIGTISVAADHLMGTNDAVQHSRQRSLTMRPTMSSSTSANRAQPQPSFSSAKRSSIRSVPSPRIEHTYSSLSYDESHLAEGDGQCMSRTFR